MLRIATKPMCCEGDFSIIRYAQLKPMARMRITHHNLLKKSSHHDEKITRL